jgi:hypothetical protein
MKTKLLALLLLPLLFIGSCKKDKNELETGQMTIRMMDGPSPFGFQEVNIDVRSVQVHIANSPGGGWHTLQTAGGIYNVLTLTNGIDTLLANQMLPAGQVNSVRLVLGPNNSLRFNNVVYPLSVPSGEESGLKVVVNEHISSATPLHLYLDFDAGQSIVQNGNGAYHLKPVVHAFTAVNSGTVTGTISVPGPGIALTFTNGTRSHTTYADAISGHFMVRGLAPGVYSATVFTANAETVFTNITVVANQNTEMGILVVP